MSDPLHHDPTTDASRLEGVDVHTRIEELLLVGLDHYFAARYDEAIHVWTRVLFLDRGHARARAYIERARGALAERQRESEELLHHGVDAFDRGDARAARELLNTAVERGAHQEEALALLGRLDRLAAARRARGAARAAAPGPPPRGPAPRGRRAAARPRSTGWLVLLAVVGLARRRHRARRHLRRRGRALVPLRGGRARRCAGGERREAARGAVGVRGRDRAGPRDRPARAPGAGRCARRRPTSSCCARRCASSTRSASPIRSVQRPTRSSARSSARCSTPSRASRPRRPADGPASRDEMSQVPLHQFRQR